MSDTPTPLPDAAAKPAGDKISDAPSPDGAARPAGARPFTPSRPGARPPYGGGPRSAGGPGGRSGPAGRGGPGGRGRRPPPRRKVCRFCADKMAEVDYKATPILRGFLTARGKILSGRTTGNCARHQRQLTQAIKRAQTLALLPYTGE